MNNCCRINECDVEKSDDIANRSYIMSDRNDSK